MHHLNELIIFLQRQAMALLGQSASYKLRKHNYLHKWLICPRESAQQSTRMWSQLHSNICSVFRILRICTCTEFELALARVDKCIFWKAARNSDCMLGAAALTFVFGLCVGGLIIPLSTLLTILCVCGCSFVFAGEVRLRVQ